MDTQSTSSVSTTQTTAGAPVATPVPVQSQVTAARATGGAEVATTSSATSPTADAVQLSGETAPSKEGLESNIQDLTKRLDGLDGGEKKPEDKVTKEDLEKRLAEMKKKLEELLGGETAPPEPPPDEGGYDGGGGGGGCDGGGCNGGGGGGGGNDGGIPPLDNINPPPSVDPNVSGDWDSKLIQACMAVLQEKSAGEDQKPKDPQNTQNAQNAQNGQKPAQGGAAAPLKLGWGGTAKNGEAAPPTTPPAPPTPPVDEAKKKQVAEEAKKKQSAAVQNLVKLYQQAKEAKAQLRPETDQMVQQTLATAGASLP